MSITTFGVALALITGALGAYLYAEHAQSVDADSKATSAQVVCQADITRLTQDKIIGASEKDLAAAKSAAKADCDYAQNAVKSRDQEAAEQKKKLQSIQNALLDQDEKKDGKHDGQ